MTRPFWFLSALILAVLATAGGGAGAFDAQGHRGARGLWPENTIPAFDAALTIGVDTLELDLGLSRDGVVVVSHDAKLSPALTRDGNGAWLADTGPALRSLTLAQIKGYDVGRLAPNSRHAKRFPDQQPVDGTRIPTLDEVFELAMRRGADHVRFNIETKLRPGDDTTYPDPEEFVRRVIERVSEHGLEKRVTLQSFDWRTLRICQRLAPGIATVYLSAQQRWLDNMEAGRPGPSPWTAGFDVDDVDGSVPDLVHRSGGAVWSPFHRELSPVSLARAHELGLKVIVWTVNDGARMSDLIDMGVDGIITDYPDRLRRVMAERGMPLPPAVAADR